MNLLQVILSVAGFVFLLLTIDLYQRKKFTIIHFMAFFFGSVFIVLFTFDQSFLDKFGSFFGVARGADLLVYIGIISLFYFYFELLNKVHVRELDTTKLARTLAIQTSQGSIASKSIVLIIPCYGENETAIDTIKKALEHGYGVVCIDDGRNSIDIAASLADYSTTENCVVITHPYNLGQGAALQTGSEYIQKHCTDCDYAVHFDADGQMQISDIPVFLQKFLDTPHLDIVLGSRNLGKESNIPLFRKIMKFFARLFMRVFVGLRLTDTHNGFRMIRARVLPEVTITLNRMAHASEIEYIVAQKKLHYAEVPVHILYTEYSLNKGQKISGFRKVFKDFVWKVLFFK